MQLTKENIGELRERLVAVRERGKEYFAEADPEKVVETAPPFCESWEIKDAQTQQECAALRQAIKDLSVDIAAAARLSPLLADADMQELRHNTRQMLANVHFSEYRHTGVYVHHDEGTVLGVDPPTHEEIPLGDALTAPRQFDQAAAKTLDLLGLLLPSDAPVEEVGRQHGKDVQPLHQLLQVPLAKLQRWSLPGIRVWWKIAAAAVIPLAALASLLVDFQAIKGWFTTDSRPVEATGGDRTSPVQVAPDPNKEAEEAAASERQQDAVLIANSRAELRERNGLRRMLDTEDGQVLSRLIGVYGFASHLSLARRLKSTDGAHSGLDLSSLRLGREHSIAREAELHALGEDSAMVLVNVSRGDAARLSDPTGDVGEIFGFFFDGNEDRAVLVGIPVSRVRTWQSRTQEFAVIDVN